MNPVAPVSATSDGTVKLGIPGSGGSGRVAARRPIAARDDAAGYEAITAGRLACSP